MRTPIVAGNWKLNGSRSQARGLVDEIAAGAPNQGVRLLVFPPAVYLAEVVDACRGSLLGVGAQDSSEHASGAYTGEVSARMLADIGVGCCLVGHSERRAYHGESSALVARKARAVLDAGLRPIICIGETQAQREAGATEAVLLEQLAPVLTLAAQSAGEIILAYEPVWAIGTGLTATPLQAQEVHAFIRSQFSAIDANMANSLAILYGGSVKPDNAAMLFAQPDVDGGLVGGASLAAADFLRIAAAAVIR
ncbi:triose-phosphate isomerase [Aquimonas sp.]|jgi:triosephosphate isomerase|uniref:triose-phosphate isomerase n=1 Tax=Aquimonas sp. TaxID=1872588 RepID=UPI0037C194FF